MVDLKAAEGCCQEASTNSREFYIPCNRPAVSMVGWEHRTEGPYRMCESCAWHNVHNRGARILGTYPITKGTKFGRGLAGPAFSDGDDVLEDGEDWPQGYPGDPTEYGDR